MDTTEKEKFSVDMAVDQYNEYFKKNVKPFKFSVGYFNTLMNDYKYWNMVEALFCCMGLEQSCWEEAVYGGNWGLTLEQVRENILERISEASGILEKEDRFFVEEQNDGAVNILCVLRDTDLQYDLKIRCSKIDFDELYLQELAQRIKKVDCIHLNENGKCLLEPWDDGSDMYNPCDLVWDENEQCEDMKPSK